MAFSVIHGHVGKTRAEHKDGRHLEIGNFGVKSAKEVLTAAYRLKPCY